MVLCVTQGLGTLWLSRRHRAPITLAWSTPGAALLVSTGAVGGGWPAAVGAFLVVGGLIMLTALWPALGDLIGAIPTPIAQAMLAGIREAALVCFLVAAGGAGFLGIGAAFWALAAGLVVHAVLRVRRPAAGLPGAEPAG